MKVNDIPRNFLGMGRTWPAPDLHCLIGPIQSSQKTWLLEADTRRSVSQPTKSDDKRRTFLCLPPSPNRTAAFTKANRRPNLRTFKHCPSPVVAWKASQRCPRRHSQTIPLRAMWLLGPLTSPPFAPTMWVPRTNLLRPTATTRTVHRPDRRQWATLAAQSEEK
jgi:hypothetical protein